jgi:3-oxoacyl-[acyl-carrier protein] reductase
LSFLLRREAINNGQLSTVRIPNRFNYTPYQNYLLPFDVKMVLAVPTASLEGKVALVTGAGRGIGRGVALELARRGASVVVNYVSSVGPAQEVVKEIESYKNGARAIAIQADVSKVSEINRLFAEAKQAFGRLDIVMSNSGTESWDKTEEVTEEKYDHVFNLNARAQFFVGQAAFKNLEQNGRLILMTSIAAGLMGVKNHALYNASKMAVIGMVKAFATDFGVKGITVNGVAPGGIKSDMFTENAWHYIPGGTPDIPAEKIEQLMAEHCPLGRCAVPEDVARVVAFLVSEDGGWVNGKFAPCGWRMRVSVACANIATGQVITISGGSSQ